MRAGIVGQLVATKSHKSKCDAATGGAVLPSKLAVESNDYFPRRDRVCAPFRAAAVRPAAPFVCAALRAAAARSEAVRREAARVAWRESARCDAVSCGSRLRAWDTARETRGRRGGLRLCWPAA